MLYEVITMLRAVRLDVLDRAVHEVEERRKLPARQLIAREGVITSYSIHYTKLYDRHELAAETFYTETLCL